MAPSPLHKEFVRERIRTSQRLLHEAVRAYLGAGASEEDVHHGAGMVAASFVMFNIGKTVHERFGKARPEPDVKRAIEMSLAFHVGGLQAVRKRILERKRT